MIYTLTLNPAIDNIFESTNFQLNQTNYYQNQYELIGGKGINVSIILKNLDNKVKCLTLLGDQNKDIFIKKFNEINLDNEIFLYDGLVRRNLKIKNLDKKEETELNGKGSFIKDNTLNNLFDYLNNNIKKDDIFIASGSVFSNAASDIYFQIGKIIKEKEAIFILDTSKVNMKLALQSNPYLIKPNIEEICEILNLEYKEYNFEEIKNMVLEMKKLGARNILLSMGSKGSYFFAEEDEIYKVSTAKGKLVNSVGAGDSMLAGFVHGIANYLTIIDCLKYGAASGAGTAFSEWLAEKELIESLLEQIQIERVK